MVVILNRAIPLFLAGLAVAVAFRMGLFNIGVEGQYRLATIIAGRRPARRSCCRPAARAAHHRRGDGRRARRGRASWRAQGDPRRQRGHQLDHAQLHRPRAWRPTCSPARSGLPEGASIVTTAEIPSRGGLPGLNACSRPRPGRPRTPALRLPARSRSSSASVGVLLNRTRFGFDLRASGLSPSAGAAPAGVNARGMVIKAMLLSARWPA